jgi:hypothetical protein
MGQYPQQGFVGEIYVCISILVGSKFTRINFSMNTMADVLVKK